MNEKILNGWTANPSKLKAAGFVHTDDTWQKTRPLNAELDIELKVQFPSTITYEITDRETKEPYMLYQTGAHGTYVDEVRAALEENLKKLQETCFESAGSSGQAALVRDWIEKTWHIAPDYPWQEYPSYEVFRHPDSRKWFALLMVVSADKIGLDAQKPIAILDLRAAGLAADKLKQTGFYPAWHMNKKYWYTIALDGTVADETLFTAIRESYAATGK